ncbi:SGNH/GDSL hydrolase family protein [candidate division CSSED10-310 bacterium]|uniref:SGNH/GDSL hydrolase family protein n=1 Tax=candidate division CSSED10-310 bacterium TaxID=2855610 RepID=A0ABV6Z4P5_UNCC1
MRTTTKSLVFGMFVTILFPLVILFLLEIGIRLLGINTDVARNTDLKVEVPIWVLMNENWVEQSKARLQNKRQWVVEATKWLSYFEEARYIQYKMKPHVAASVVNYFNPIELQKQVKFKITSNSQGFRTKEFSKRKGDHVLRAVALGDSSTFGWGVSSTQTFSHILEEKLNGALPDWDCEVLNLGLPGYTSVHGINLYDTLVASLAPDILIISFGANDPRMLKYSVKEVLAQDKTWVGALKSFLRKFKLYGLTKKIILYFYNPFSSGKTDTPESERHLKKRAVSMAEYKQNLTYFIDSAREKGIAIIFIGVCTADSYLQVMKETALQENVPFLEIRTLYLENYEKIVNKEIYGNIVTYYENLYGSEAMVQRKSLYFSVDGCHPNIIGHNLIGEALYNRLKPLLVDRGIMIE